MVVSAKRNPDGWRSGFLLIFFPPPAPAPPFSGRLLSKTLSTLSICSLLLLATFILFTLSTFEPSSALRHHPPRRRLLHNSHSSALQGMGTLYRRGTRAMPDLIVAHVSNQSGFRIFLRILHSAGLLARSDLLFIFSSNSISSNLSPIIRDENHSLLKLLSHFNDFNRTSQTSHGLAALGRYLRKDDRKEPKETIWGKGFRSESNRTTYGSIVGFESSELDPENSLSGFLDHVPISLRRWACYPMLLGRLKRNYKHVLLTDTDIRLNDPFARLRNRTPESIYLSPRPDQDSGKLIVAGGSRGVRRLSNAVLTEIVRLALDHKNKNKNKKKTAIITESGVMNRLLRSPHFLKNVNVMDSAEPAPGVVQTINSSSSSMRDSLWCWSDIHNAVYRDCLDTQ